MIELRVEPRLVKAWETFCMENPPYSIALDGYVEGAPKYDHAGPRLNLNHHEGVDRLSTRSTSGQVYIVVKQGLFDRFRRDDEPTAIVYINDPDQDTSLAVWLLRNHQRIAGIKSEPLINRLVFAEDMLDATAGAYPFDPDSDIMHEQAWIFDPYIQSRISGHLQSMTTGEMEGVIDAVGARISDYSVGKGRKLPLDTRYEVIDSGNGWVMIHEIGQYARTDLFSRGVRAFVSVRERKDKNYTYTLGRMSQFIPFAIEELYGKLNDIENISSNDMNRWGGGNIIGGSPRQTGSKLKPVELAKILKELIH